MDKFDYICFMIIGMSIAFFMFLMGGEIEIQKKENDMRNAIIDNPEITLIEYIREGEKE